MATYSYNDILAKARTCKSNIEKTHSNGIPAWWGYYIAKEIISPKTSVTVKTIRDAPHPNGTSIKGKVYKADFLDMCKRLVKWVDNNGNVMPNYITYKNYRFTPDLFLEMAARILVFYADYKVMPNYANIDSNVFAKPKSYTSNVNTHTICDEGQECLEDYAYSMNVVEQSNPNRLGNNHWQNMGNAIDYNEEYCSSTYTVSGSNVNVPEVLAVADFNLNIPEDAYITMVRFEVKIKIDNSSTKVKSPTGHFMIYKGNGKVSQQTNTGQDGWYGSTYRDYALKDLSTSWQVMTYSIYEEEFHKMAYPATSLNSERFGLDLYFEQPSSIKQNTGVQIAWVRVKVGYVRPNYRVTYSPTTSLEEPLEILVGEDYCIDVNFENTAPADGGEQVIDIELPFGTDLKSYAPSSANFVEVDNYHYKWTVDGKGYAKDTIRLCLNSGVFGYKTINSSINDVSFPFYVYPFTLQQADFGELAIDGSVVQKAEPSCFKFFAKALSNDNKISYTVVVDGENQTDWSKVSSELLEYYNNPNQGNCILNGEDGYLAWELDPESISKGISIDWENTDNNIVTFNVPEAEEVEIRWSACFIPLTIGENTLYVVNGDTGDSYDYQYNSLAPNQRTINPTFENITFNEHRIVTQITNGAYFLTMAVKPTDRFMVQQECSLKAHLWRDLAYIGCVPIQHAHYDPEHDTTNGGISETFKNITYKGKEMEIKENTSLNIKLPPRDWTTLKGLTELDKPIPVNTVPQAFEGDVLNHRGWAEITGVKGINKTNPLYYDGEVELDYLTHNINSRFIIQRGGKSFEVQSPNLLASVLDSGEEFAHYTYVNTDGEVVTNPTGYFIVDTDGAYIYDSDMSEESRTLVALDNKQYVEIKSEDPFTENASVTMRWHSTKIAENRENQISREICLVNEDDKIVFKYVYHDFEFDTNNEYYSCMVKGEKLIGNVWTECINKKLYLAVDVESLQLEIDANGNLVQESDLPYDALIPEDNDEETEIYQFNDYTYGSTLSFMLKGNSLDIVDTGMNGRQIAERGIVLEEGKYKLQVIFKNNNRDSDTLDVITFFDFEVSESILSSDYGLDYGNMYISSFPVIGKTLLFTRQSEDGTIYYFKGADNEEFSYIQEPYYMYSGGVDLTAGDGQSIFNLNNSYTIFYMQNGLVRIGFNRINGELYISKYDLYTQQYINVARLQCQNKDFTVGSYSDDKIQIVAGTTVYTMYRGHPYIIINHPDEDIDFETSWNKVFSEMLNGEAFEFPVYFDLLNHDNLLPVLNSDDLIDADVENIDVSSTPSLSLSAPSETYIDEPALFSVSGSVSDISDNIPIYNSTYVGNNGNYSIGLEVDNSVPRWFTLNANKKVVLNTDTALLNATLEDYEHNGISGKTINFYEVYYPTSLRVYAAPNPVLSGSTSQITATLLDEDGSTIYNESVKFYANLPVALFTPTSTATHGSNSGDYCYSIGLNDINLDLSSDDFSIEFDYNSTNVGGRLCLGAKNQWSAGGQAGKYYLFMGYDGNGKLSFGTRTTTTDVSSLNDSADLNSTYHFKMVKQGHTITYFINGNQIGTKSENWVANYHDWSIYVQVWRSSTITISNIKIKDLEG